MPPTDPTIGAVLCGFDINLSQSHFCGTVVELMSADYRKLANAFAALRDNEGCEFILTNQDATYPTGGTIFPGQSDKREDELP